MKRTVAASVMFAGALSFQSALFDGVHASETHGTLSVAASVASYCDIGGSFSMKLPSGLLDFGSHQLLDTRAGLDDRPLTQPVKGTMPLLCSDGDATPQVSFGYGLHAKGRQRNLQGPGGSLVPYDLLRGSNPGQGLWDENSYPVYSVAGKRGDIPVYGYIPALPVDARDGTYSDTVTVAIDF
jgi:spore coat protein U-like protein